MVFVCTVIDRRHPEESITHASSRGQHWTPDTHHSLHHRRSLRSEEPHQQVELQ